MQNEQKASTPNPFSERRRGSPSPIGELSEAFSRPKGVAFSVRLKNTIMKNLNYLLLIFIFSGCQKIINEQDFKISKIGNVDEMNLAINGLYARLEQYINNHNPAPQYLADDMKYGGFTKYIDGGNGIATDNWKCLYNIITSANNIIVQVQNTVNIKTEMKAGLGEAYLLRAYAYFSLVRIFGAVPIVNNIEVNSALSKSSIQDVYAFIESNLLKGSCIFAS